VISPGRNSRVCVLRHLLARIKERWGEADPEIRDMYHAIRARINFERRTELVSEATSPAAMVEPHQNFQPGADTLLAVAEPMAEQRPLQAEELQPPAIRNSPPSTDVRHEMMPALVRNNQEPTAERPASMPKSPVPIGRRETAPSAPESPGTNGVEQIAVDLRQKDEPLEGETSLEQKTPSLELMRMQDPDQVLERLDEANAALDAANTLEEVKQIADVAAAAHLYAKRANRGKEAENKAACYVCRALFKLGTMMPANRAAGKLQKQGRPKKKGPKPHLF